MIREWCQAGCERGDGVCCPDDVCDIRGGIIKAPTHFCPRCMEPRQPDRPCYECGALVSPQKAH